MMTELTESRSVPYHKVLGPYKRDTERGSPTYNKVVPGEWSMEEFAYLATCTWNWTEKVDGTNVRVHWDGTDLSFGGRTDKAQLPPRLIEVLEKLFLVEVVEQTFGAQPVTLYGEGYGGRVQHGGNYRLEESFILFDVRIGRWWLKREDIVGIAGSLQIDVVPELLEPMGIFGAIEEVKGDRYSKVSRVSDSLIVEGVIGTPTVPLLTRAGERIIIKVKTADFRSHTL